MYFCTVCLVQLPMFKVKKAHARATGHYSSTSIAHAVPLPTQPVISSTSAFIVSLLDCMSNTIYTLTGVLA